jgi:hypothetical protein
VSQEQAKAILAERLARYRAYPYERLAALVGSHEVAEYRGSDGVVYQLEFEFLWDDKRTGEVRVMGGIDGGTISAIRPLTDSFIRASNGRFVDE